MDSGRPGHPEDGGVGVGRGLDSAPSTTTATPHGEFHSVTGAWDRHEASTRTVGHENENGEVEEVDEEVEDDEEEDDEEEDEVYEEDHQELEAEFDNGARHGDEGHPGDGKEVETEELAGRGATGGGRGGGGGGGGGGGDAEAWGVINGGAEERRQHGADSLRIETAATHGAAAAGGDGNAGGDDRGDDGGDDGGGDGGGGDDDGGDGGDGGGDELNNGVDFEGSEDDDDDDDDDDDVCRKHAGEPLDSFCCDEQLLGCRSCAVACAAQGHQVANAYEEFATQRRALVDLRTVLGDRRRSVESHIHYVQGSCTSLQESAERVRERVRDKYAELRRLARAEEAAVLALLDEELQRELRGAERELQALRGATLRPLRDAHGRLGELLRVGDADGMLAFLKIRKPNFDKLWAEPPTERPPLSRELSAEKVALLEEAVDERLRSFGSISVPAGANAPPFHEYARSPTLDPSTAHPRLLLSADLRSAACGERKQRCADNSGRFDYWEQVLATQAYGPGRHYWELDVSRAAYWRAGAAYGSIARKGSANACGLGRNEVSWCARRAGSSYTAVHAERRAELAMGGRGGGAGAGGGARTGGVAGTVGSSRRDGSGGQQAPLRRLGVYLDHEAGELSFYDAERPAVPLHTFLVPGGFTQPLHPALRLSGFHGCSCITVCSLRGPAERGGDEGEGEDSD
ncbi:tripartite motif-containing protein 14-like [Lethenteron reissneri]|uniref:tripartite motif-containing protein 14-like n=1 Tax=Lethenteron reissneri TaxID=7753 RepID=UPI002AB7A185|nr:tripartite motif-containing protein 14-like [Lethenteron reissneri]XP_061434141.1 tripartite motif-containing protein 14-like [Lethenteron reissneri]